MSSCVKRRAMISLIYLLIESWMEHLVVKVPMMFALKENVRFVHNIFVAMSLQKFRIPYIKAKPTQSC